MGNEDRRLFRMMEDARMARKIWKHKMRLPFLIVAEGTWRPMEWSSGSSKNAVMQTLEKVFRWRSTTLWKNWQEHEAGACSVQAHESTRSHWIAQLRDPEDLIAEKGFTSLCHYNLVYKPRPVPKAMKISYAKVPVEQVREKLEQLPDWQVTNVKRKQGGHRKGTKRGKDSSFCDADGPVPPQ